MTDLFALLASWDAERLGALIEMRGVIGRFRRPGSLTELVEDVQDPWSIAISLTALPTPAIELVAVALTFGQGTPLGLFADHLEGQGPAQEAGIRENLDLLTEHALAWADGQDRVYYVPELASFMQNSFEHGLALETVFDAVTADVIRSIIRALGLPHQGPKAVLLERLRAFYRDGAAVRKLVASAPADVASDLAAWLSGGSPERDFTDRASHQRVSNSDRWARDRGLHAGAYYEDTRLVPAAVLVALNDEAKPFPFHPDPPIVSSSEVDDARVRSQASASSLEFSVAAAAVLDIVARQGIPLLKSGAVGNRELVKLVKSANSSESEVRLILEAAAYAGLLESSGDRLQTSDDFEVWRTAEPAVQLAILVQGWWELAITPTVLRDGDGKSLPALRGSRSGDGPDDALRGELLLLLADHPGVGDPAELFALLRWYRPLLTRQRPEVLPLIWAEASTLGVIGVGACSPLAKALLAEDLVALATAAGEMLPAATTVGTFGSDLTVMVSGSPTSQVRQLLDGSAVRESRGNASIWRFSQASVRSAFDAGQTAKTLTAALSSISNSPLPQTLTYLINDVARRHGHATVTGVSSCLTSDDPALLAEIVAHRSLRKLNLRLLAPTVAASDADTETTLAAVRAAGYMPMGDIPIGVVSGEGVPLSAQRSGDGGLSDFFDDIDGDLDGLTDDDMPGYRQYLEENTPGTIDTLFDVEPSPASDSANPAQTAAYTLAVKLLAHKF